MAGESLVAMLVALTSSSQLATGFLAGFQIAIFAFVGVELIGTTAAEKQNPELICAKSGQFYSYSYHHFLCVGTGDCHVCDAVE